MWHEWNFACSRLDRKLKLCASEVSLVLCRRMCSIDLHAVILTSKVAGKAAHDLLVAR